MTANIHGAHKDIKYIFETNDDSLIKETFVFKGSRIKTLRRALTDYDSLFIDRQKTDSVDDFVFEDDNEYTIEGFFRMDQYQNKIYIEERNKKLSAVFGKGEGLWKYYLKRLNRRYYPPYLKIADTGLLCLGCLLAVPILSIPVIAAMSFINNTDFQLVETILLIAVPAPVAIALFYSFDLISMLFEELIQSLWEYYIGY
ncbi:MAG: hypothetical protein AB7T10_06805 [bacterium]